MSKITVNRRGPVGHAGNITLEHLRNGETFRFPRSAVGTVYQMLRLSERSEVEDGLEFMNSPEFLFSNVSTGQIHSADENRVVVPVDCSLTARERQLETPWKPSVKLRSPRATKLTSTRKTTKRSR